MDTDVVVPLAALGRDDLRLAGGKGANLGELVRAGFAVPEGFVVTTAAYDAAASGTLSDASLADAITDAYAALGRGRVAVRSSATAEDLPGASFAGQQDTYLGVEGADAVVAAVRDCWASLWTERAVAYRADHGGGQGLSIAVVVQRLVDADVAGVMFTANPVTGRRDETVVTASWGLGESVVSGRVEPDEYQVVGDRVQASVAAKNVMTVLTPTGTEDAPTPAGRRGVRTLTDAQVRELAAVGARIAAHFGTPQDIEWALADGQFAILQARPITALPEPTGPVPTEWPMPRPKSLYFRASIVEQLPDPLSPLFAGMVATAVPDGLLSLIREMSPRTSGLDAQFPTINGYAYYDYSRAALGQMMSFTPAGLVVLSRQGFVHDRWHDRELPRYRVTVARWSEREPAEMDAAALVRGAQELVDAACLYYTTVQSIIPVASTAELTWTGLYAKLLGGQAGPAASDFLVGFSSEPIRAELSLYDLAQWVRERQPAEDDPEFLARLDAHLAEHGHLLYNLDLVNPVPADDPEPVLVGLRHAVAGRVSDPHERLRLQAQTRRRITAELMARLDPVRRRLAEKSLAAAQRWAPIREDALAAMGLGWPTARRLLRELGLRLVAAGVLETADDVYWLTRAEAEAAASDLDAGREPGSKEADVAARKETWRGQRRATPPQSLPEGGMGFMDRFMPARESADGPSLVGTTGTGGRVTGRARLVTGPEDFAAFEPGEILVASITTPAFTPLFARAAGVVTDIGGVLSHGSIVAREYGIPAVLGTGAATRRIATGDEITVDGPSATVFWSDAVASEPVVSAGRRPARVAGVAAVGVVLAAVAAILAARRRRRR